MFKIKIKIKGINAMSLPKIFKEGEWIDLYNSKKVIGKAPMSTSLKQVELPDGTIKRYRIVEFDETKIPLGVAMKLPDGYEAILAPRSSSYKKYGFIVNNSIGIIDNSYSGDNDEWKLPVEFHRASVIESGERVCQFRIQLSQKATLWQKLKWLLSTGVELEYVDHLDGKDRGGFGEGTKHYDEPCSKS